MKNEYAGRLNILTRVSTGSKLGQKWDEKIVLRWWGGQRTRDLCTLTLSHCLRLCVLYIASEEN